MRIIIIGDAGFSGANTALRFCECGVNVIVMDNLSRRGTRANLEWLRKKYTVDFERCDIRNYHELLRVFRRHTEVDAVIHLAAQSAVNTSVTNPREDCEINAAGTFNVLEAVRECGWKPIFLIASSSRRKLYSSRQTFPIRLLQVRCGSMALRTRGQILLQQSSSGHCRKSGPRFSNAAPDLERQSEIIPVEAYHNWLCADFLKRGHPFAQSQDGEISI